MSKPRWITIIVIVAFFVGIIFAYIKISKEDLKIDSNIDIEKIILPDTLTYVDLGLPNVNVEYSTDNYIEIVFDSEIANKEEVKVYLLQTGSYVHLRRESEEDKIYQHDNLYEVTYNKIKIIPSEFHNILPNGFLKININNLNSKNVSLYCTTTKFNTITFLKYRLNLTNDEKYSMILPKTNKDNKKIAYITENTELLDESGKVIRKLYLGDNVEIINENSNYCSIYYPNMENVNALKTINANEDIYNSKYVEKYTGYIRNNTYKIIPSPKNDDSIVEVYVDLTSYNSTPIISVTSPYMGYNYKEITNTVDITDEMVSKLEDELLIRNKVFMLPSSYWSSYVIDGEEIDILDPRSQPYIMNLTEDEYMNIRKSIIEYYNLLEEKWKACVVSENYINQKELTIQRAKRYIEFELCWIDWIAIDRMNDLDKFADRVYEKFGNSDNKTKLYSLLNNLDEDYQSNMIEFIDEFLIKN